MSTAEVGTVLDDKYEILEHLASGGMGELYLARHLHLQESRIIKILRKDLAADPNAQKRFLREARFATQVKHPNVAIVHDYSRLADGRFYMVWEYVEGEDVGHWLEGRGPFPLALALALGVQALRGLEAIHAVGLIHRDLAPDNLMITRDLRGRPWIKIIDLGLAKNLAPDPRYEVTQAGMFMGKLFYCSPEQAGMIPGATPDHRSDLYSFALVLYEMICGRAPFDVEHQTGAIFKRLVEEPLPLAGRNPEVPVPEELDRVVRRALERQPANRYPDAASFIEALERVGTRLDPAETRRIDLAELEGPPAIDAQAEAGIEQALAAHEITRARRLLAEVEASNPRAHGLDGLKARVEKAEEAQRHQRVHEAEQMLESYLAKRRATLADFALETLLDLLPDHPKRDIYRERLAGLRQEAGRQKQAEEAIKAGRIALSRGDLRAAHRHLRTIERSDPTGDLTRAFTAELSAAEARAEQGSELERLRQRLEEALASGDPEAAEQALEEFARLEENKVTVDLYRERVLDARRQAGADETIQVFERRYIEKVAARDWHGAREVVVELDQALPGSSRPAEMFAEVDRMERGHQHEQALEQGAQQLESLLAEGQVEQAELTLKVLLRIEPNHPRAEEFDRKIRALKGA